MKETYYFPHDYTASRDPKVLMLRSEFGIVGYALFFMVLESMAEEQDGKINRVAIGGLSVSYGVPKEELTKFIDYCIEITLFIEDETGIYSLRMLEHKAWRKGQSDSGKKGAYKRWHSDPNGDPNAKERKGKEIKGKESKEEEDIPPSAGSPLNPETKKKPKSEFIPPTLEEFKNYFVANGYLAEVGARAWRGYSEADPPWTDSQGNKIRSWKQKCQHVWFKPDNEDKSKNVDPNIPKHILNRAY